MGPASDNVVAVDTCGRGLRLRRVSGIAIRLHSDQVTTGWKPIHSKTALAKTPIVRSLPAIGQQSAFAVEIFPINPGINVAGQSKTVPRAGKILKERPAARLDHGALSVPGV